jgi:hypothetical protein
MISVGVLLMLCPMASVEVNYLTHLVEIPLDLGVPV